jgi:hypothetical protein
MKCLTPDQSNVTERPDCPLCGSHETQRQARIGTDLIVGFYGKDLQNVVRKEFNGALA